jgi:hypothetical protein
MECNGRKVLVKTSRGYFTNVTDIAPIEEHIDRVMRGMDFGSGEIESLRSELNELRKVCAKLVSLLYVKRHITREDLDELMNFSPYAENGKTKIFLEGDVEPILDPDKNCDDD